MKLFDFLGNEIYILFGTDGVLAFSSHIFQLINRHGSVTVYDATSIQGLTYSFLYKKLKCKALTWDTIGDGSSVWNVLSGKIAGHQGGYLIEKISNICSSLNGYIGSPFFRSRSYINDTGCSEVDLLMQATWQHDRNVDDMIYLSYL